MRQRMLKLLEASIEKIGFTVAAIAVFAMAWLYLLNTPNRVPYDGNMVAPHDLDWHILSSAEELQQRIDGAELDVPPVPTYAEQLQQRHQTPIFQTAKAGGVAVPVSLRRAAPFGAPIPELDIAEFPRLELVAPLRAGRPVLRTGRSMIVRTPPAFGADKFERPLTDVGSDIEPVAVSWVSVAAYFDLQAQRNELTKAGYPPFLSQVYVVDVEVQRQKLSGDGEYSDWREVEVEDPIAPPDVPEPVLDEETGAIINRNELDNAFAQVKQTQATRMQPQSFEVAAGEHWRVPPLDGYCELFRQARVQAEKDLAQARRALRKKDYARVRELARLVADNRHLDSDCIGEAKRLLRRIEELQPKAEEPDHRQTDGSHPGPVTPRDLSRRFVTPTSRSPGRQQPRPEDETPRFEWPVMKAFVRHPESMQPAVWFHDDTAVPGKTYRYRLRVRLWNRCVGRMRFMRDPEAARHSTIVGEWSLPSDAITVMPMTHFFVRGQRYGEPAARVDVWKWHAGDWLKASFDAAVGDTIGGVRTVETRQLDEHKKPIRAEVDFSTGATVLDVRPGEPANERFAAGSDGAFGYRQVESTVLVYLDPTDEQVKEKTEVADRHNPIRRMLERL